MPEEEFDNNFFFFFDDHYLEDEFMGALGYSDDGEID